MMNAPTGLVGLVVNRNVGHDVRALSTGVPPLSPTQLIADVQRMITGALENGARRVVVPAEPGGVVASAAEAFGSDVEVVANPSTGDRVTTIRATAALRGAGVDVIIVSGGDGTHRDVASTWRDATLVARAAGTNNAFGQLLEPTIAGMAAGLAASIADEGLAYRALSIDIDVEGEPREVALTNAATLRGDLTETGPVWRTEGIDQILAAVAEPWSIGLSALVGSIAPTSRADDRGVLLDLDDAERRRIRAATSPGVFCDAGLCSVSTVELDQAVSVRGPCVFVLDGERSLVLERDQWATMTLRREGPWVVDIRRTLAVAVRDGRFLDDPTVQG